MKSTWRIAPWNDLGHVAFDVGIDGDAAKLITGAGGLRLTFSYEIKTHGESTDPGGINAHIISLEGWIGHERDGNCLTLRIPSQTLMPDGSGLAVPVTREQLASFDAQRGLDSLRFNVLLSGTARIPVSNRSDPSARNQHGMLMRPEVAGEVQAVRTAGSNPVALTISRERWLNILSEAGPRRYRLIELPVPNAKDLSGILDLLEESVLLLRRGEWSDAISKARKVVEGVLVETARHWAVQEPDDGHVKWCEGLGRRLENAWHDDSASGLLFGRLLAAAWSWTSEEHHYAATVTSKRAEAEFAIGLASDLLLLADELVNAHPNRITTQGSKVLEP
jgi:hypothetical protein